MNSAALVETQHPLFDRRDARHAFVAVENLTTEFKRRSWCNMLASAQSKTAPERLTWDEICVRYPDEWVVLVEFEREDHTDLRFHAATVVAHHKTRKAASADVKIAFQRYDEAASFFTGELVPLDYGRRIP